MRPFSLLFVVVVLFSSSFEWGVVNAGTTFKTTVAPDYYTQYYWNDPPSVVLNSQSPKPALMIAADGFNSIAFPNSETLFTYYDTIYGYMDYTNKESPALVDSPIGFSHASFAKATIKDGVWATNFTNTPSAWTKIDPNVNNNFYWPHDGLYVGTKLHLLVQQVYVAGGGEYGNGTNWLVISNPLDSPDKWIIASNTKQGDIEWNAIADDGTSSMIYVYGNVGPVGSGKKRVLGAVLRADLANGAHTIQCWAEINGVKQWSKNCNVTTLVVLYDLSNYLVVDAGTERWSPFLKKWIRAFTLDCDFYLYHADTPMGPWTLTESLWKPQNFGWNSTIFCYQPNLHPTLGSAARPYQLVASVCTWDFNKYYGDHRPYYRATPTQAPHGDMWVYIPAAIKLNFTITSSTPAPTFPLPFH